LRPGTVRQGMRFAPECVPCLLNRVLYEVQLVAPDRGEEAMITSLAILDTHYKRGMNSAALATQVHRAAYDIAGSKDPYEELKRRSDETAEKVYPRALRLIEEAEDSLEAATVCAIAGNVLDFGIEVGIETPEQLERSFQTLVAEGLAVNDLAQVRELLRRSKKVLYLLDNCGESVFDRLLVREIKRFGVRVIGVVKGEPILTDVTMEDAKRAHLDREFDEIMSTGQFAVGLDIDRVGDRLAEELRSADLIIAKGMANFEALSDEELGPILYLMRAKCSPVARAIGAKRNDNVARLAL